MNETGQEIFVLVRTNWDGDEEWSRSYFRNRSDAIAKAREMMDEELPRSRKTRSMDISEGVSELEKNGATSSARLYSGYRIETGVLF